MATKFLQAVIILQYKYFIVIIIILFNSYAIHIHKSLQFQIVKHLILDKINKSYLVLSVEWWQSVLIAQCQQIRRCRSKRLNLLR